MLIAKLASLVNGDIRPNEVQKFCALDEAGRGLLRKAARIIKEFTPFIVGNRTH